MTLRDYFAAKAPIPEGLFKSASELANENIGGPRVGDGVAERLAQWAYRYADAMLKARAAKSPRETWDAERETWGK